MIRKKNSFFTFIFSLLPGAGHMYMGFMGQGVSLMTLFFGISFLGSWLEIGPSLLIAFVVWFYAFFDCLNRAALPDEEFYQLEDEFFWGLFDNKKAESQARRNGRIRAFTAAGLILVGIMILWQNFWGVLYSICPEEGMKWIFEFSHKIPRVVFALVIIYIGLCMIVGKKKELDRIEQIDWEDEEK